MTSEGPGALHGNARDAYLTHALVPGIGAARLGELLRVFGTAEAALGGGSARLQRVPGIGAAAASAIASADRHAGRRARERCEALGGRVLLPGDRGFPGRLRTIPDPPVALFALGAPALLVAPSVAVVGSRDPSPYGREVCAAVSAGAAEAGLVVVSGMARGLDAVAHGAALEAGGTTVGILGNGLGVIYPAANRALYAAVAEHGLLLTELPPGERPHAGSFPQRNRLIAGLAAATVVVEAAAGSGALITAGHALEQGREVLAVPGPVTSRTSVGTNRLLRDGARPLLEMTDLLELYPGAPRPGPEVEATGRDPRHRLLALLRGGPRHVDQLARGLAASSTDTLALLGGLEIEGTVEQRPGLVFARRGTAAVLSPT